MKKYIVREVAGEDSDFSFYFDDDGLTEVGGDFCNNLFIVTFNRRSNGFNSDTYKDVIRQANGIYDGFTDVTNGIVSDYDRKPLTYKNIMDDWNIDYNSRKCAALKAWVKDYDGDDSTEAIAAFLTITTGKKWETDSAHGYCQGDYVELVYCAEHYKGGAKMYGEVWLGAAKEFCVIELDENGDEGMSTYGYIIADCQARNDEDYKRLVCEWAGISEDETTLEMIDNSYTTRHYTYRTA